jgi:hypothetical protein
MLIINNEKLKMKKFRFEVGVQITPVSFAASPFARGNLLVVETFCTVAYKGR